MDSASQSHSRYSSSNRGAMASVNAWRDQQASISSMNSGNRMNSNLSSLDDDTRAGSRGGGGGGSAENRLLDDSASSDGGLGGRTKRSHGDSQGDGSKDEPRRKRHVTTPHQVAVLSEELRRNPFPSLERRDELAKELGMEPRRIQVWFQNRRQAERLARGRPPYNMMFGNPWYPGYPYAGYMPGPYPPMSMTGDPSMDVLIPYGPRRPSAMPPLYPGDSMMIDGTPTSHPMSGPLAPRTSSASMHTSAYQYGEGSGDPMRHPPPTSLAEDLAALEQSGRQQSRYGGLGGKSLNSAGVGKGFAEQDEAMKSTSRSLLHPLQSTTSPDFSLPPPSTLNRGSGLPSLSENLADPFQLPPPKMSSRIRGITSGLDGSSTSLLGGSPFDPSRTLAPPRLKADRSSGGRSGNRLPSLSQALEMHPELSPDPTSFRYPAGYEQSLLGGGLGLGIGSGSAPPASGGLRRRSSLSRMNESTSSSGLSRNLGGVNSLLGGGRGNLLGPLPPFPAFDSGSNPSGDSFRSPALSSSQGSASRTLMGSPSSASHRQQQQHRALNRMPSDATMHSSIRRQSLRDSEMARDAYSHNGRYGL